MDRKLGYLLLLCGLGLIVASSVMLWKIFYGTMEPPQAFGTENTITISLQSGMKVDMPMPPQVNRFANLSLGFMLMFFLAIAGGKVGDLGVKLVGRGRPEAGPPDRR